MIRRWARSWTYFEASTDTRYFVHVTSSTYALCHARAVPVCCKRNMPYNIFQRGNIFKRWGVTGVSITITSGRVKVGTPNKQEVGRQCSGIGTCVVLRVSAKESFQYSCPEAFALEWLCVYFVEYVRIHTDVVIAYHQNRLPLSLSSPSCSRHLQEHMLLLCLLV